ncbi:MAG: ankyrin repeat domain-containing protein [Fusobacteriaceae bacterium]|jgi:ankyrin repeat protein|nr:ankyrin repeat domain-containing protein [Fusobacteriaceae bacterium]
MNKKNIIKKIFLYFSCIIFLVLICGFDQSKKYATDAVNQAAYVGDIELIREILKTNPDRNARDSFGGAALHDAMFQKNMEIVLLLIENGYDINAVGPANGYTPLHDAVMTNNIAAVKLLIRYGANRNIKGKDGLTPLEKAIKENKGELVKLLSE